MVDPITAFGATASAVQLIDVALRASREAYSFLTAIKDAKKEIKNLRDSKCPSYTSFYLLKRV